LIFDINFYRKKIVFHFSFLLFYFGPIPGGAFAGFVFVQPPRAGSNLTKRKKRKKIKKK
jgi:hypothetical protein